MKIPKSEIPQADTLEHVLDVAYAVKQGARTDHDIAQYIHMVDRQGRYYRLAAEILGLVQNEHNYCVLTPLGQSFTQATETENKGIVKSAILNAHVFQRMVPFFELHEDGATRKQVEDFISEVTAPTTVEMIHRRTSTLISWLEEIGVLTHDNDLYRFQATKTPPVPILQFPDEEPLALKLPDLNEYKTIRERREQAGETIQVLIDQAAHDRANVIHRSLINIVADRLRDSGSIPKSNRYVDLAATTSDQAYLFEMKSVNDDNSRSQVRNGLSQLYEYRYLQNLPDAELVLVISEPLTKRDTWMQAYLEEDRNIHLVWDGNNQLFASKKTKQELSFLWQ